MLPSLDNFVSYGTDVFKANADYRHMLVDIYTTSINSDHLGENDAVNGCKLAEAMMLNLRGHVDDVSSSAPLIHPLTFVGLQALPTIIATAVKTQDAANSTSLRLANLEVLINTVLYNPGAALHLMESYAPGTARAFFDKWFEAINGDNRLPRVHDKKLSAMALSALLEMDPAQIPDSVKEGWPGIVSGALRIFKDLPKAIAGTFLVTGLSRLYAHWPRNIARQELEEAFQADDDEESTEAEDTQFLNLNESDGQLCRSLCLDRHLM